MKSRSHKIKDRQIVLYKIKTSQKRHNKENKIKTSEGRRYL